MNRILEAACGCLPTSDRSRFVIWSQSQLRINLVVPKYTLGRRINKRSLALNCLVSLAVRSPTTTYARGLGLDSEVEQKVLLGNGILWVCIGTPQPNPSGNTGVMVVCVQKKLSMLASKVRSLYKILETGKRFLLK